MSVQFQAYAHQDVASLLPQRTTDIIKAKVAPARADLQALNGGKVIKIGFRLLLHWE